MASLPPLRRPRLAWPEAPHFALGSGDCHPTVAAGDLRAALAPQDRDRIEAKEFHASDWIKIGLKAKRVLYRRVINERWRSGLFRGALAAPWRLGLTRRAPADAAHGAGAAGLVLTTAGVRTLAEDWRTPPEDRRTTAGRLGAALVILGPTGRPRRRPPLSCGASHALRL